MKVTIFGGTGATGNLVVEKAITEGHWVTLYARTPSKVSFQHPHLKVVKGKLKNAGKIRAAVKGADAVISLLGPGIKTKGLIIADGTKIIISAMKKQGVKRLIATATACYNVSQDKFQFGFSFSVFVVKTLLKDSYRNIVETGSHIVGSKLDWTLVRLPILSNKPATGNLKIGFPGDGQVNLFSLSRADLADFLVQQLEDETYIGKTPVISN